MTTSKQSPKIQRLQNKVIVPFDIKQITVTDEDGGTETMHQYQEIRLDQKTKPSLEQLRRLIAGKLNEERDRRIGPGMSYNFPDGQTGTIQLRNMQDKANVQGLGSNGLELQVNGDTTTLVPFRDGENIQHSMTGEELVTMGKAVSAHIQQLYADCWDKKDDLESLNTEYDIIRYDFDSGWTY